MYRDCLQWSKEHLPLSTPSNLACKLFDSALTQYISWQEDPLTNGLSSTLSSILVEDPEFIMGHVLNQGISLMGNSSIFQRSDISANFLTSLVKKHDKNITIREKLHVQAIEKASKGDINEACDIWEGILVTNPTDILAAKFAHDAYFYLGFKDEMRDSIARILPLWDKSLPLYSFLYGMLSFGLAETNYLQKAEETAKKGLEINRFDGWATHSIAHCYEYQNNTIKGVDFLLKTEKNWEVCGLISPHLYWHLCLYYIENNEHDIAWEIARKNIVKKALETGAIYDLVDAVSLIIRLKIDGYNGDFREEIEKLCEVYKTKKGDHGFLFNDLHVLLLFGLKGDEGVLKEFMKSFEGYCQGDLKDYLRNLNRKMGLLMNKSILDYQQGKFEKVVENLSLNRYKWQKIGGSNAQRDIFHQILVDSAIKSKKEGDREMARMWINERICLKPDSELNKRFMRKLEGI